MRQNSTYSSTVCAVMSHDKLLPNHRGPFQVLDRMNSIYTIEDLVCGKRSSTHIHNLRPFNYDPVRTLTIQPGQLRPFNFDNCPAKRTGVRRRINPQPPWQPQSQICHGVQSPMGWIRRILRQLGALQGPFARRQTTRLPEDQYYEDSHPQGA